MLAPKGSSKGFSYGGTLVAEFIGPKKVYTFSSIRDQLLRHYRASVFRVRFKGIDFG